MRLRGDINVLLLGDPGTAKSQLLKFVEKVYKYTDPTLYVLSSHPAGRTDSRVHFWKGF
jgi:DNA replicative helicase MCM subunit Mcm2 (Cdc46/Mcm family)